MPLQLHPNWNRNDLAFNDNGELVYNRKDLDHSPYLKAVYYCLPYDFTKIDKKINIIQPSNNNEKHFECNKINVIQQSNIENKIIIDDKYDDYDIPINKHKKYQVNKRRKHTQRKSKKQLSKYKYDERREYMPDELYDNKIYLTNGQYGYECEDYCCTYCRDIINHYYEYRCNYCRYDHDYDDYDLYPGDYYTYSYEYSCD